MMCGEEREDDGLRDSCLRHAHAGPCRKGGFRRWGALTRAPEE